MRMKLQKSLLRKKGQQQNTMESFKLLLIEKISIELICSLTKEVKRKAVF